MKKKFDKERFFITIIFLIVAFILLGVAIFKIIKEKDINAASTETTILLLVSVIYVFYKVIKDKNFSPTNIKGEKLPTKEDKETKRKRIKSYLIESLVFSIIVVCLDFISILFFKESTDLFIFNNISSNLNIFLNLLITFILCMLISFGFEYLIGELFIKKERISNSLGGKI